MRRCLVTLLFLLCFSEVLAQAQHIPPTDTVLSPFAYYSAFGSEIALHDDWLAISADGARVDGKFNVGKVFLYRLSGGNWELAHKLLPPAIRTNENFGAFVGFGGGRLLVTAARGRSSAVYLYKLRNGKWILSDSLQAADQGGCFGCNFDAEADRIVIGDRSAPGAGYNTGAAYVFDHINGEWKRTAKLFSNSVTFNNRYGYEVALDGDVLMVGEVRGEGYYEPGRIYVYRFEDGEWVLKQRLEEEGQEVRNFFGAVIALTDTIALTNGSEGAMFYAFRDGMWSLIQEQALEVDTSKGILWGTFVNHGRMALLAGGEDHIEIFRRERLLWTFRRSFAPANTSYSNGYSMNDEWLFAAYDTNSKAAVFVWDLSQTDVPVQPPLTFEQDISIYPNPADRWITIELDRRNSGRLPLRLVDTLGRVVETIYTGFQPVGRFKKRVTVTGLASGVYYVVSDEHAPTAFAVLH